MVRTIVSYLIWPLLFGVPVALVAFGMDLGIPGVLAFNIVYLSFAAVIFVLERVRPHETAWHSPDSQIWQDLGHTVVTKGVVQVTVVFAGVIGLAELVSADGRAPWPVHWPMWAQAALGMVVAEFGLYWMHRISHEWYPMWRFHALHHSVRRLWFVNTGRFHFVDTLISVGAAMPILALAGAPSEVFIWVAVTTAFVGMLTHANIEMRCGPLNYIFNTPVLHRWHHSTDLREGNKNYGEVLIIYDLVFGTYINPDRRPPTEIGITEAMPSGFWQQLWAPFWWTRLQKAASDGLAPRLMSRPAPSAEPSDASTTP